jgi:hypothetical protein
MVIGILLTGHNKQDINQDYIQNLMEFIKIMLNFYFWISSEPYFPQPDYLSGLQYAHLEELSNSAINHVLNGFSAGSNVVKSGVPTDELERLKKQNN